MTDWASDHGEEFKRCVVDERASNELLREGRLAGRSLCGEKITVIQRVPHDAPIVVEGCLNRDVRVHYAEAWSVDHWFNHYRAYGGKPMYGVCQRCALLVAKAFSDPSGHYVRKSHGRVR